MGFDTLLISFGQIDSIFESIVFLTALYFLHDVNNAILGKLRVLNKVEWSLWFWINSIIILISYPYQNQYNLLLYIRNIAFDLLILYLGLESIIIYRRIEISHPTTRMYKGRLGWLIVGIMAILIGMIRLISFVIATMDHLMNNATVTSTHPAITSTELFSLILYTLFGSTMLLILFFSPETLLMSEHQLLHLYRLYGYVEEDLDNSRSFWQLPLEYVKDYLLNLDKDSSTGDINTED